MTDLKILNERENQLLNRKELIIECNYPKKSTPKTDELKNKLSEFLKINSSLISIKKINQIFGNPHCNIEVHLYKDENSFKKYEVINKKKKAEKKEGKPKQEVKK